VLWLERLIKALFPTLALEGSLWQEEWEESQRRIFLRIMRVFLPIIASGYLLHYFGFDKPAGLEPLEQWFLFRVSTAGLVGLTFLFYLSPLIKTKWYKVPAILLTCGLCYSQANVSLYYPAAPWLYPFLFVLASTLMLRLTAFQSLIYSAVVISIITPTLLKAGIDLGSLASAGIVILIVVAVTRSSLSFEIRNFLLNKENAAQQSANLELQHQFSDRLKSFIPKVIASRIQTRIDQNRGSVIDASVHVLQARKKQISCLFSDIRGFTQSSKNLDDFISESVLPEVKAASEQIEQFEGIPRKIGDLIFAYFDDDNETLNALRAILAGINLSLSNRTFNETVSKVEITRYILISSGEAIVGNLGGIDSSVEITALGSPVNFLSRLDDATKDPLLAEKLTNGDIIITTNTSEILEKINVKADLMHISLAEMNLQIKDFPETQKIAIIKPTNANFTLISEAYDNLLNPKPQPSE